MFGLFKKRKKRRAEARWLSGYDYAAGELLRSRHWQATVAYLENCTEDAKAFNTDDEFDDGVASAIRNFKERLV